MMPRGSDELPAGLVRAARMARSQAEEWLELAAGRGALRQPRLTGSLENCVSAARGRSR
jgi:hypothetical protein